MISYIFNRNVKFNLSKILNFSFFAFFLVSQIFQLKKEVRKLNNIVKHLLDKRDE